MIFKFYNVKWIILIITVSVTNFSWCKTSSDETKTILVAVYFHNGEIVLPFFFSFFQRLTYPKNKISLHIRGGNSYDKSNEIVRVWIEKNGHNYRSVELDLEDPDWVLKNHAEEALLEARRSDVDYLWFLDPSGFITDQDVLQKLIGEQLPVAAPLMSAVSKYYSNFWGKISSNFWYERSKDYIEIVKREKQGCFEAALLNSFFLIDMKNENSKYLTFNSSLLENYIGPTYPQMVFAVISSLCDMKQYICNREDYGVLLPITDPNDLYTTFEYLDEAKTYLHMKQIPHKLSDEFLPFAYLPASDNFGFNKVYVINLAHHSSRKHIMNERLMYIGLNATFFEGVDGDGLNETYLSSIGFKPLEDCGRQRLSMRDVGWSLSHYNVWDDMIRSNYSKVMVFEDSIQFNHNFPFHLEQMLEETDQLLLDYDLIYLCRFIVNAAMEHLVLKSNYITNVENSNLACGYILTREGAEKLRQNEFISNMIPVDEYMITKYANKASQQPQYAKRARFLPDLKAFSIHPLVAHPVLYSVNETKAEEGSHQNEALGSFFNKVGEANVAVASKYYL